MNRGWLWEYSEQNGEALYYPVLRCHGYSWKADLNPRGGFEDDHEIYLTIFLVEGLNNHTLPKTEYSIQMICLGGPAIDGFYGDVGTRCSYI